MMKSHARRFFPFLVLMTLLLGCRNPSTALPWLHHVTGLGSPPIDYVLWSPTKEDQVLVTAHHLNPGDAQVYFLDIVTKKKTILAQTEQGDILAVTWLPGGKEALFVVSPGTQGLATGYWIAGGGPKSPEVFGDQAPDSWSPDGTKSIRYDRSGTQLYLTDIAAKIEEKIYTTKMGETFYGLSWSPDGRKLVFSMGDHASRNLYIMDIATGAATQITEGGRSYAPAWSPRDGVIAFQSLSDDGLTLTLRLIKPDGTCQFEIPELKGVRSPTWSPDGNRLGFVTTGGFYYLEMEELFVEERDASKCFQAPK